MRQRKERRLLRKLVAITSFLFLVWKSQHSSHRDHKLTISPEMLLADNRRHDCSAHVFKPAISTIWLSAPNTFAPRNHYALQSIFRQAPCVTVSIFTDSLPENFFHQYVQSGYRVKVLSLEQTTRAMCDTYQTGESTFRAGCAWFQNVANHDGPFKHVHLSDMFRLFQLYHFGGSYVDFDHIFLAPIFDEEVFGRNVLGTEVCNSDNPDCLYLSDLAKHENIILEGATLSGRGRETFSDDKAFSYTPCNGVMLNWEASHWLLHEALVSADLNYDPQCWGCLGPRMFGKILKSKRGRYHITLLPPGKLYAFDYKVAPRATREVLVPSETYTVTSTGVHLYGKVTADMDISRNSTYGLALAQNALTTHIDLRSIRSFGSMLSPTSNSNRPATFETLPADKGQFLERANRTKSVLICHPKWLGIREATEKMSMSLGFPVVFVESFGLKTRVMLYRFLQSVHIRSVHVQGFPDGTKQFVHYNVKSHQRLTISITYHSGVGVHNTNPGEAAIFLTLLELAKSQHICLLFLENDQAAYAEALGASASVIGIPSHIARSSAVLKPDITYRSPRKIGLLGTHTSFTVKNFWPQISAACMLEGVEIHTTGVNRKSFNWLISETHLRLCRGKIFQHTDITSTTFEWLLAQMDINMYISITEAVPNVVTDSLSAGIPVLLSDTTEVLNQSETLRRFLVVNRIDDQVAIRDALIKAFRFSIEHKEEFRSEVTKITRAHNTKVMAQWSALTKAMETGKCPI